MSIRVLHVISHLGHRGADQQIHALAQRLPREEYDLHVCAWSCCTSQRQALEQMDVPVAILAHQSQPARHGHPRWRSPIHFWQLSGHICRLMPRVVHAWPASNDPAATRVARLATLLATRMKRVGATTLISSCWKSDQRNAAQDLQSDSIRGLDRLLDRFTERLASLSRQNESARSTDGYAAHSVCVPLGIRAVPCQSWSPRHDLLREFGLPTSAKLIVAYSDYSAKSRFKDAIWTADLLKVIRDDTHLVMIGDGPLFWRGERFRDQVKIKDRVHLITDCCQWDRLIPYADCYWDVDGQTDSLPFTATAMANGVPVIAAETAASRELLGETARYFAVGHRGGLARHCQELLEKEELSATLSARGRERAKTFLSMDKMIQRYAEIYRELAKERSGA